LPEDKKINAAWDKEMADAKEYVRKLNIISTKDKEETTDEPESSSNAVIIVSFLQTNFYQFFPQQNLNQKFGLCEALCRVGAWTIAQKLFSRIPETCLMSQPSIALALCELLHTLIEPVYRK
jgi:THO complex subunit 2